ncbi:hypothetical protein ACKC9G_18380 [Pokkaliibacter sp. CJK22405]|uniref:hypothetical protein n=1 Tax=Pokkaliibacter sp. CJK22405 TaxID=3384615 RepID=UPI003984FCAB
MDFDWAEYEAIRELMDTAQGKVILSIGDHPDIRALFAGLRCDEIPLTHTVGGNKSSKNAVELVYYNW